MLEGLPRKLKELIWRLCKITPGFEQKPDFRSTLGQWSRAPVKHSTNICSLLGAILFLKCEGILKGIDLGLGIRADKTANALVHALESQSDYLQGPIQTNYKTYDKVYASAPRFRHSPVEEEASEWQLNNSDTLNQDKENEKNTEASIFDCFAPLTQAHRLTFSRSRRTMRPSFIGLQSIPSVFDTHLHIPETAKRRKMSLSNFVV
mmetsp:Transcript_29562/g.32914  ORF Transcript_29562/g.32914 Transcript_29562/m.32914 type:complete len:206 (+) Transcript_29562:764-1381(+)